MKELQEEPRISFFYEIRFTLARRAYFALAAVASSGAQAAEVATKAESAPGRRSQEATMAESAQRAGTSDEQRAKRELSTHDHSNWRCLTAML